MRLRQIALVAHDLARVSDEIADVLGLGPAYADPGVGKYGLVNAVWPIGDTFLEVVSPAEPGTTAGRLLEKRGGDGGYMAIFQTRDIEGARRRIADLGVRVVSQADRDGVWMTHLHPKDVGGAIVSIDAMDPPERWDWGGPDWRDNVRTDVSVAIVGAEMQAKNPEAMARRWAEVLDAPVHAVGEGFGIGLDRGEVRFVSIADGRGEGLGAFDVAVHDPDAVRERARPRGLVDDDGAVVLSGTRVCLVEA